MSKKYWNHVVVGLLILGDAVAYILALQLTAGDPIKVFLAPWMLAFTACLGLSLVLSGRFTPEGTISRVDEAVQVARSILVLTVGIILVGIVFELHLPLGPRGFIKLGFFFGIISVPYRWIFRSVQKYLFRYNLGTQRTLIVGVNRRSRDVHRQIMSHPKLGYDLLGFIDTVPSSASESLGPVVGDLKSLPDLIQDLEVDEVIITLEKPEHESLLELISTINGQPIEIKILPDMYEAVTGLAKTEHIYGLPLVRINPEFITQFQAFVKRVIDIYVSGIGLLLSAPLMLVIAILVRLTSPGPAIFTQERLGCRGKRFTIHKFRTMVEDAEQRTGPVWAQADDPRITLFGRLLRRVRLDELPQLWNVLKGDMSLVGPRPERPHFVEWLVDEFPYYYRRLLVRPGITGWAQVRGNYDSSIEDVRRKLKDDFFYIENLSIRLDLKILLMTVWVVLRGKGH
ncbi:MAG: sugar transferase [Fidelibacterota bacterium]|nr:MAG: sugar transferase [Candidatus Neomarinimicrobiota bacterium]